MSAPCRCCPRTTCTRRCSAARQVRCVMVGASRVCRRSAHWRALPLAERAIAGLEGRARAHGVVADAVLDGDQLCEQFHRGLARELLEPNGQRDVLTYD